MSIGLIALLNDIAAISKVAAASPDDVAGQVAKAGVKAAGVIIDDTAVTLSCVIGFAERFARFMLFSRLQFQRGALGTFMLIAPHRFGGE